MTPIPLNRAFFIGDKEVLYGVDKTKEYLLMVCYCTYDNPLFASWAIEAIGSDDYLEAMQVFVDRVQKQIELTKEACCQVGFDMTPFTVEQCIPDNKRKVSLARWLLSMPSQKRYEYRALCFISLFLLMAATVQQAAEVRQCLALLFLTNTEPDGNGNDVLGEIKPEYMPDWAKGEPSKAKAAGKKSYSREER